MQVIVPYLTVKGAGAAVAFYQKAFDAKEYARHAAEDGKRFMHIPQHSWRRCVPV